MYEGRGRGKGEGYVNRGGGCYIAVAVELTTNLRCWSEADVWLGGRDDRWRSACDACSVMVEEER